MNLEYLRRQYWHLQIYWRFNPTGKEVIVRTQRNARRLNRLISNILDVTKIESQRLTLRKEVLDITDLVFSIAEEYKEQLKNCR